MRYDRLINYQLTKAVDIVKDKLMNFLEAEKDYSKGLRRK